MANKFLMKGKVWHERKDRMTYPAVAEVKYDEIRCHVKLVDLSVQFLSYEGNLLNNMGPWVPSFYALMLAHDLQDLDVGILVNGNFNDSYRWVRSSSGIPKEKLDKKTGKIAPELFTSMVEFYLFDLPSGPESLKPYHERVKDRAKIAKAMNGLFIPTKTPHSISCLNESEVDAAFLAYRAAGFEGAMVKSMDHTYKQGGRIDGWLKMKPESEADGRITGFNQAISEDGIPLGRVGSINVECEDGSTAAPAGIAHGLAKMMWDNPQDYIGDWLMFNYMERDRSGGYRHPTFGRLREKK